MTMRAITKIPKGREITHAYTEPLDPLMTRRSILELGKFFQVIGCNCHGGQLYVFSRSGGQVNIYICFFPNSVNVIDVLILRN